jgi:predicted DNA-binding ribbon-helix-helix protein
MRTTLTIDDDVAAALEQIRKNRKLSYKALVKEALRQGLKGMVRPPRSIKLYHTKSVSLGRCFAGSLDDISEVLEIAE